MTKQHQPPYGLGCLLLAEDDQFRLRYWSTTKEEWVPRAEATRFSWDEMDAIDVCGVRPQGAFVWVREDCRNLQPCKAKSWREG